MSYQPFSKVPNKKSSNFDKIFIAIQNIIHANISLVHCEAKGYAYKTLDNKWSVLDFSFVNDIAGLGNNKRSLL